MTLVAIHQPNFFPWLGFFHKIANSNIFIYLDHVHMNPDQTWVKRVRLMNQGVARWLSIPIKTEVSFDFPAIQAIEINTQLNFENKHLRTIEQNYHKTPYFREIFPFIEKYYHHPDSLISNRNIQFIESICQLLEIPTQRIRSSSLDCRLFSTDLLIEIVRKVEGHAYICGGGASKYQENEKFIEERIELIYQNFVPSPYPQMQSNSFVSGLSILDCLMNNGPAFTRGLITNASLACKNL